MFWVFLIGGIIFGLLGLLILLAIVVDRSDRRNAPGNLEGARAAFDAGDIAGCMTLLNQAYVLPFGDGYTRELAANNLGAVTLLQEILNERERLGVNAGDPELNTAALRAMLQTAANGEKGGRIPYALAQPIKDFITNATTNPDFQQDIAASRSRRGGRRGPRVAPPAEPAPADTTDVFDAVHRDPTNESAYLVLADHLQSQGNPRGELIVLQHRNAPGAGGHFEKHKSHFLGELADHRGQSITIEWKLGYIRSAHVDNEEVDVNVVFPLLLNHPSSRFLQSLTLGILNMGAPRYREAIEAIVECQASPLRSLFIGDFQFPADRELSWSSITGADVLWKHYPTLHEVTLQAGELDLGDIDLPEARSFEVRTGGLDKSALSSICKARWPKLGRLVVWFGDSNFGADVAVEDVAPILDGSLLRRLDHLGLMNAEFTDALCERLGKAKILPQLKSLDLSMGTMSDMGAAALAANKDAFAHLERLDVSRNYLTPKGLADVRGLCGNVALGSQRAEEATGRRYVAVGE